MTFLLILILFFLLFPLFIKLILKLGAYLFNRKINNIAKEYNKTQQKYSRKQKERNRNRGKIFTPEDGEYVNFEEIKEERIITNTDDKKEYIDDRITDVKFEEIKD